MYKLRARYLEEDLVSTGVADAFGGIEAAIRAVRFEDRRHGFYRGTGGLIGEGGMLVDRYQTTATTIRLRDTDFINYERALTGSATLMQGDTQLTTGDGIATIARKQNFDISFLPTGQSLDGIQVTLFLAALDRFLATGGEKRAGPVKHRVVEGSGVSGPDGPLLSLTGHILNDFEAYRHRSGNRRAQLAEALLTELFVQLLRDVGSLTLRVARHDTRAEIVRRAEDFVHAHCAEPLTIADVAAAVETNLRSLEAAFKGIKGMTPRQYLTSVRMERARQMILAHPWSHVTLIAFECGFTHLGRFGQAYKAKYGELPSEAARRRRNRH